MAQIYRELFSLLINIIDTCILNYHYVLTLIALEKDSITYDHIIQ